MSGAAHSRIPPLASGLALALLASSAAQLTWLLLPPPAMEEHEPLAVAEVQGPSANLTDPVLLSREIAARHLLGSPRAAHVPADQPIPETRLNLLLRGVAASTDPAAAFAIIAEPGGKENFFKVGDTIPGDATLKEVHPQHIVLARGDRFETLRLPEQSLPMGQGAPVGAPGTGAPPLPAAAAPDAGAAIQQLREQFTRDPQSLANLLQGEPFRDGGRLVGYRVRPGRDAALFAKLGLQSGDVVTAVNGISVMDPQGRLELMRDIESVDEISVDLLRAGVPQSVVIPIVQ